MSFLTLEKSSRSGAPVELYKFSSQGFAEPFLFTSGDVPKIVFNSQTYRGAFIERSQFEHSKETAQRTLEVTVSRSNALAAQWLSILPPRTVWLTIYRYHRTSTGGGGSENAVVYWQGKVRGISFSGNQATLECLPTDAMLTRTGLRRNFGSQCGHMLYSAGCGLSSSAYQVSAEIIDINRDKLTSSAFASFPDSTPVPNGWWTAGFIERPSNNDIRYISGHSGHEITLLAAFEGLSAGETLKVYAGCDHSFAACKNKFANVVNFGGWPYVPLKNPFEFKIA